MFLCAAKVSVNAPRFTSNPPQLHHKNTTFKTHIFAKPPAKTAFSPRQKKLLIPPTQTAPATCQKQREGANWSTSEVLPWHWHTTDRPSSQASWPSPWRHSTRRS